MEVIIVSGVGDAMLSAFFRSLFETMSSPDFLKFSKDDQVVAETKKLRILLLTLNAVLEDAEDKQTTSRAVKLWLRDLQQTAFHAEDVVDELATETMRRSKQLELTQYFASTNKVCKFFLPSCFRPILPSCFHSISRDIIKFNAKMKSEIKDITAALDDLATRKTFLNLVENGRGRSEKVLPKRTSSLVDESCVYGRESDRDAIINLLMHGGKMGRGEIDVVPIVGMGGVGKTTLAQLVYNDEKIEASFDLRAWVCVSEEFDVLRVTETLLHAVAADVGNFKDLNLLQVKLREKLLGRKFLIILDDIWNENCEQWDVLCRPFAAGAAGSKILVTTRNKRVAAIMVNGEPYHLKELSDGYCLSLFTWHALQARNFNAHPNLKAVGEQIVKRCKGLPLAVKTLAGLLRTKVNRDEWEEILMSKIWDLPEERSNIIPALRLSYHHLPSYLKRCFAYCALFPKDYEFDKDELVLLWMAEGFLQKPEGNKQMEGLGFEYFNELVSRCFFQYSNSNRARFVMHDLINDLAQSVSEEIGFSFEDMDMLKDEKLCVDEKIRYLSFTRKQYDTKKRFEILYQMKNIRTLAALPISMPLWAASCYLSGDILHSMFQRLRRLRVLSLSGYCISELPNSIGHLKHLRYLNLSRSRIKQLPQSVGSLLNLQTLILQGCKELMELPQVIKNLVNLRVLDLTDTSNLQEMPSQIGNLKNLQILSKFIVGKGTGSAVGELRGLLHLRGELSILGLENVVDFHNAISANLKDKHGLTGLDLQWSREHLKFLNSLNEEVEMNVLDKLRPHENLEKLRILFYGGKMFPSWLGDPLTNIASLELFNCIKSNTLPSLGSLPNLRMLSIIGLQGVKMVGSKFYGHNFPSIEPFPSLQILQFKDMLEWTCWSPPSQANEDSGKEFPHLRSLMVENCPKLSGKLPGRLFSLEKLVIKRCPKLECSSIMSFPSLIELTMEDCNEELIRSILGLTSPTTVRAGSMPEFQHLQNGQSPGGLKVLVISNCFGLTSLWRKGDILLNIASLQHLKIKGCSEFVSLAENGQCLSSNLEDWRMFTSYNLGKSPLGMHALESLKDLQIESCPDLVSFPETGFLPMLKHLKLKDCKALKSLPSGMMMLNCPLEELEIEDCPALTCFPSGRLPTTLKRLRIGYCSGLMSLPNGLMQTDNGISDISHLENLEIISCDSLISFPEGKFPTSLKKLKIWKCSRLEPLSDKMLHKNASLEFIDIWKWPSITSLPEYLHSLTHLIELNLSDCPALKYFPETGLHLLNLRKFEISNCSSLKSLPDQMLSLTSLRFLTICQCPDLVSFPEAGFPPNLLVLEIWDCENLKQPMSEWNLDTLASLKELSIGGAPSIVSFPDEKCLLPPTLVSLYIVRLNNLQSLSTGLCKLTLLEELEIAECPKLRCLPKEGLPAKLGRLCIRECQLLKRYCLKDKGAYGPVIAHIPYLEIEIPEE